MPLCEGFESLLDNYHYSSILLTAMFIRKYIFQIFQCIFLLFLACSNKESAGKTINTVTAKANKTNNMDNEAQESQALVEEKNTIETARKYEIDDLYSFVTSYIFHSLSLYDEIQYGFNFSFYLFFNSKDNTYAFIPDGPPYEPWAAGTFLIKDNAVLLTPEDLTISKVFLNDIVNPLDNS